MRNFPTLLLLASLVRPVVYGASLGDALVIIGLSALWGYMQYIESKREIPVNKAYTDRLIELEEQVKICKDNINSVKLGVNLRKI